MGYKALVISVGLVALILTFGCSRVSDEPRIAPTPLPTVYIALPTPTPFFTLTTAVSPPYCADVIGAGDYVLGTSVVTSFSNIHPDCSYSGWELDISGWVKEDSETPYGEGCGFPEPECNFIMNSNLVASYFFNYE